MNTLTFNNVQVADSFVDVFPLASSSLSGKVIMYNTMNSQIDEKDDTTFCMQEAFHRRLRVSH